MQLPSRILAAGLGGALLAAPASAVVLYEDDFSGTAGQASTNSTPEAPAAGSYNGNAFLAIDGNGFLRGTGNTNGNLRLDIDESALAANPVITVTLQTRLGNATGGEWIGFGFGNNDSGAPLAQNGSETGLPWLQILEGTGQVNHRSGEATDVPPENVGNVNSNGASTIVWTIDTSSNDVSVTIDGGTPTNTTLAPSVTPTFDWVMFRSFNSEATTTIDSVRVEANPVPEPGSLGLLAAGAAAMLRRRR